MEIKQLLAEKAREFAPLFARMDADKNQVYAAGYELKDPAGNRARGVFHVNLPDARHFVEKAKAKLGSVNQQVLVTAHDPDEARCEKVEHFLDDLQLEADTRLVCQDQMDGYSQHSELICVRGRIAEQVLLRLYGDELIADIRPVDCRYLLYEADAGGLKWAAPFYMRGAADIESEYGLIIQSQTALVQDYWDSRQEVVFIDGREMPARPNPYGYPPFVLALSANTSALKDDDSIKRRGDSILHLCRTGDGKYLFEERNYYASILKTQASETLKPPLQKPPKSDGTLAAPAESYPSPGEIISTDSRYELIPRPDVRQSTQMYAAIVDRLLDRATFGDLQNGVIDLPLSAVAINRLLENQNENLLPCLNTMAQLFQASARMRLKQFNQVNRAHPGQSFQLGEPGRRRAYKAAELNGEYSVRYRYYITSQEQLAGGVAIANSLGGLVSESYKLREVLKLPNATEILAERDTEQASRLNPAVQLYEETLALIDRQEATADIALKEELDTKARLQFARMKTTLRQRQAAANEQVNPPQPETVKADVPVVPVFANNSKGEQQRAENVSDQGRG